MVFIFILGLKSCFGVNGFLEVFDGWCLVVWFFVFLLFLGRWLFLDDRWEVCNGWVDEFLVRFF